MHPPIAMSVSDIATFFPVTVGCPVPGDPQPVESLFTGVAIAVFCPGHFPLSGHSTTFPFES